MKAKLKNRLLETEKWEKETLRKIGFSDHNVVQLTILRTLMEIKELLENG